MTCIVQSRNRGIKNGLAAVIFAHTNCGIIVNEGLLCVERDLQDMLEGMVMVPPDAPYAFPSK